MITSERTTSLTCSDKRQGLLSGAMAEALGLIAKPAKRETMAAIIRKDAIREKIWFGPFTLPPLNVRDDILNDMFKVEF